jgi:hypothetical protein
MDIGDPHFPHLSIAVFGHTAKEAIVVLRIENGWSESWNDFGLTRIQTT